jgi:hypothetical protein
VTTTAALAPVRASIAVSLFSTCRSFHESKTTRNHDFECLEAMEREREIEREPRRKGGKERE